MKKIAILTSVLALAACGGGSGHHHDGAANTPGSNSPDIMIPGGNNPTDQTKKLEPVIDISQLSQIDFSTNDQNGYKYKFVVNDGKIVAFKEQDNQYAWTYHIDGDKINKITEHDAVGNAYSYTDVNGKIELLGKDAGLQYSDFGYLIATIKGEEEEINNSTEGAIFTGGRADKLIEQPQTMADFHGTAVASINAYMPSETGYGTDEVMIARTDDATLHFENGAERLTMNFSQADNPWYDVVATKDAITLSNGDGIKDDMFKVSNNQDAGEHYISTKYFGDNGNVNEAVANTKFSHTGALSSDTQQHNISVDAAFGGVLNK